MPLLCLLIPTLVHSLTLTHALASLSCLPLYNCIGKCIIPTTYRYTLWQSISTTTHARENLRASAHDMYSFTALHVLALAALPLLGRAIQVSAAHCVRAAGPGPAR